MNDIQQNIYNTALLLFNEHEISKEIFIKIIKAAEIEKESGGTIWAEEEFNNTRLYIRREKDGKWVEFDWYDGVVAKIHDSKPHLPNDIVNYKWVKLTDGWAGSKY